MFWNKAKITDRNEHRQLFDMLTEAKEAPINGSARSGTHYALMHHLAQAYNIRVLGREAAMQEAEKLLEQWERDNSASGLSDSELDLLNKADEW